MKKILLGLLISLPFVASAAPIFNYNPTLLPITTSLFDLGTSTKTWRNLYIDNICFTSDTCKTAWPTGGSGGSKWATSTGSTITPNGGGGILILASSTLQNFTGLNSTTTNATSTSLFSHALTTDGVLSLFDTNSPNFYKTYFQQDTLGHMDVNGYAGNNFRDRFLRFDMTFNPGLLQISASGSTYVGAYNSFFPAQNYSFSTGGKANFNDAVTIGDGTNAGTHVSIANSGNVTSQGPSSGFSMGYDGTNSNSFWNTYTDSSYNYRISNGFIGGDILMMTTSPQAYWGGLNGGHPLNEFDVFLNSGQHYFSVGSGGGSQNFKVNSVGDILTVGSTTLQNFTAKNATTTNATTTTFAISSLATPAGTILAVNPNGTVIATSSTASLAIGGNPNDVQFNLAGALAGNDNFTFSSTTSNFLVSSATGAILSWHPAGDLTGSSNLYLNGGAIRSEQNKDGGITAFFGAHTVTGSTGTTTATGLRCLSKQQSGTGNASSTYVGCYSIADSNRGVNIAHEMQAFGSSGAGSSNVAGWSQGNFIIGYDAGNGQPSIFPADNTGLFVEGTASTTNLTVSSAGGGTGGCATFSSTGVISSTGSTCSSGGSAYPFSLVGNATSTLTQFNGGLTSYASTTIGNNTTSGGLTINGGATTTGQSLHLASTTLQNFTFTNGTGTSATTTNFFATKGNFTNLCISGDCKTSWPTGVTGSGTTGTLPIWTSSTALGNSPISYSGGTLLLNASTAVLTQGKFFTTTGFASGIDAGFTSASKTIIGDVASAGNGTLLTVDDSAQIISIGTGGNNIWDNSAKQFEISGKVVTVSTPTGTPVGAITYALPVDTGTYYYTNGGYNHQIRVYAYKDTTRGRIYSSGFVQSSIVTDNGANNNSYYITWTGWTVPAGADGVQVLDQDNYNGISFGDVGFTLTGTTLYDSSNGAFSPDTDGWQDGGDPAISPTSVIMNAGYILGGTGFGTTTPGATWDFVGDVRTDSTLNVGTNITAGGSLNIIGSGSIGTTLNVTGNIVGGGNLTLANTAVITASTKLTLSTSGLALISGTPSGSNSIATQGSTASGGTAVALQGSTASNTNSFAAQGSVASGNGALSFMAGTASGQNAVAIGSNLTGFSPYSYIMGQSSGGSSANNNYESNSFVIDMKSGTTPQFVVGTNGIGIFDHYTTVALGLGGESARTIQSERRTTANNNGNNLTVQAGGGTAAGAITVLNGTPTNAGTGYGIGDNFNITTGGTNGRGVVTAVSSGTVTGVQIEFGGSGYTTGTGKATSNITGSGTGLTVNISTVSVSTDLNGGTLVLSSGISTGAGTSQINLNTFSTGSTGTTDNSATTKLTILSNGQTGISTTTPFGKFSISSLAQQSGALPLFLVASTTNATLFDILGNGNVDMSSIVTKYNNISTVSNGVPAEYGTADPVTQSSAITATTICASTLPTGMYRISAYEQVTRGASTSSILGGATGTVITYNDGDGNVAQTDTMALTTTAGAIAITSATNSTATNLAGSLVIYMKTGTAVQYAIGYTSVGVTSMQYSAHLKCEAL